MFKKSYLLNINTKDKMSSIERLINFKSQEQSLKICIEGSQL
jgi:hypothetical protein